jgi:hypothetical protein
MITLPPLLTALVAAHNAHDVTAFAACFSEDAVVRDEGQVHFGRTAIHDWFEDVSRKYAPTLHVAELTTQDGEPVLHGKVSGNFPGSPLDMDYYLAVEDREIVALKIAARTVVKPALACAG